MRVNMEHEELMKMFNPTFEKERGYFIPFNCGD